MIKQLTKRFFGIFGVEVRKSNSRRFNKLGDAGIPYEEWELRGKKYYLKLLDISVPENSTLISAYKTAKGICQHGGHFFYDMDGNLRLTIQGINFFINYTDELFVISEVFVTCDYNFKTRDELVVVDIGLNIGATALFFSKQENVRRIYSYELFEPTFRAAQRNLTLNDSSKIVSINVGLGRETRELQLPYSAASKARMGLKGLPVSEEFPDATLLTVSLIDAAEEIQRIDKLEPGIKKICKMDCEGAEFEILDQLFYKNVIDLIDIYIIEWHNQDPANIEVQFLKSGFDVLKPNSDDPLTGLIYAFKQ
jgi:FkbM family methyltransferase